MIILKLIGISLLAFMLVGCSADKAKLLGPEYSSPEKSAKINELYELLSVAGFTDSLKRLPETIEVQMKDEIKKLDLSQAEFNELLDSAQKSFNSNNILKKVLIRLDKELDQKDISKLLEDYNSLFIKMIKMHESYAASPEGQQKVNELGLAIFNDVERVKLMEEVNSLMGITRLANNMGHKMNKSFLVSYELSINPKKEIDMDSIDKMASFLTKKEEGKIKHKLFKSLLFGYKNVSNEDMQKYINWLKKPYVQNFYKGFNRSFELSINSSIDNTAKSWSLIYKKYNTSH